MTIKSFEWFNFDSIDDEILLKYCSSEKDLFLCWWLISDVQSDSESINELLDLSHAVDNDAYWRGGSYDVRFIMDDVKIIYLRTQETNVYKSNDIISILREWKEVTKN